MDKRIPIFVGLCVTLCVFVWLFFSWTFNRYYVHEGYSLQLRYKGPLVFGSRKTAKIGHWAEEGEIGILREMRGPGRHFYCPVWYERRLVSDVVVEPGKVGVVTCKIGDPLPEGQFLVDGEIGETSHKGILRKVLGPGRYRINPYGYEVKIVGIQQIKNKHSGWVTIPIGYVGVVTNLSDNPVLKQNPGIQDAVLPPGIYPMNPNEQQVDIISVGYMETTVSVEQVVDENGSPKLDASGEPMVSGKTGINFPSNDGFPIFMDFTAVWGLMPEQCPHAVRTFGTLEMVEEKIVLPQIESICRNNGSKYAAVQLLVGEEREKFQETSLIEFQKVLSEKEISLLYGLVRHTYIPEQVRLPIQQSFVADELTITREQEQLTARTEALLKEAEKNVGLATEKVNVDTERQYQTKLAEGDREAKRIEAETARLIAAIDKQTAQLRAQATAILGEAENKGKQMVEQAKADKFRLAVQAFGTANAYNNWTFATGLPDNIELDLFYAGEGTLWTDMKDVGLRAIVPAKK